MLGLFKDDAFFQPVFKLQFCIENTILSIITMIVTCWPLSFRKDPHAWSDRGLSNGVNGVSVTPFSWYSVT